METFYVTSGEVPVVLPRICTAIRQGAVKMINLAKVAACSHMRRAVLYLPGFHQKLALGKRFILQASILKPQHTITAAVFAFV